jgi:hypothetical protein
LQSSKLVVQTTVSIQPVVQKSKGELQEIIKEAAAESSCVLKTDREIDLKLRKMIKQSVISEKPYKKNEALEFWRRQRLQFITSPSRNQEFATETQRESGDA